MTAERQRSNASKRLADHTLDPWSRWKVIGRAARAIKFIREHAVRGIMVDDVLREVPMSRRGLEIQFKRYLGRSPAAEIRRIRLEKGRDLLATTDLSVAEVASACGFSNATRLGVAFRHRFGMTPVAFRKHARGK